MKGERISRMLGKLHTFRFAKDQEDFRQHYIQTDIDQARIGILLFVIPLVVFIYNDYSLFKLSGAFFSLVALRLILLTGCILTFIFLPKVKSYRLYDKILLAGSLILLTGGAIINATRPENYINQVIIASISVLVFYLVIPTRFLYQFILATIATVGEIIIISLYLQPSSLSIIVSLFLSLIFANLIGSQCAWQVHAYRRKSFQDIQKSKELQEQLEQHSKHLEVLVAERSEKLKSSERLAAIGATAGMVGHDIRNPLTAITGAVYLAKKELKQLSDGDLKDKLTRDIELISEQTKYVNKIVEDLQDYARPLNPNIEQIDLEQLVNVVLSELKIPQNITVELLIEDSYPKLKLDFSYMRRILTNLFNNAIQAMPNGGKLTIKANNENGKARISIEDTGSGIPEEVKARLFTPLVTTKSKGQGFGLAVVKRLTEALNGTINYESEAAKGTKFIIEYPLN